MNTGNEKVGGLMNFQPILPIPLYGEGDDKWKMIVRPSIPILFSSPVPTGPNNFNHLGGFGDIGLPLLVSPPSGDWLLGLGPTFLFPTATRDEFGDDQFGLGPAWTPTAPPLLALETPTEGETDEDL